MSKPRVYTWTDETPQGQSVRVTAEVSGFDYYGSYERPQEWRDVCVVVERSFCPSTPDRCDGCEYEDITEQGEPAQSHRPMNEAEAKTWEEYLEALRCEAVERDDEAATEIYDRAHEYEHEIALENWAERYDGLNGAPESEEDR